MGSCELPPGFRFHPTDEELIMHYLRNQATSKPCPASIIPEVDFYKFDPWQLPEKAEFGENEWYFFTPRDRKYPNGVRPNRATVSGYWKATGTDKAIYSGSKYVGVKKALVFYEGRPPKGVKSDWIMHEYRLIDSKKQSTKTKQFGSMRLDDWVLCRIYKKRHNGRSDMGGKMVNNVIADQYESKPETRVDHNGGYHGIDANEKQEMMKMSRAWSLSHILEMDLGQLLTDHSYPYNNTSCFGFQNNIGHGQPENYQQGQDIMDLGKHQPLFVNPVAFEF